MRTKLNLVLSAVGVAALLESPAMAKTLRHHALPSTVAVPSDAHASVASPGISEGGVYTPSKPAPLGKNNDFQDSPR
jgi:hypothetical protein